jgi:hypothetical protein
MSVSPCSCPANCSSHDAYVCLCTTCVRKRNPMKTDMHSVVQNILRTAVVIAYVLKNVSDMASVLM